MSRFDSEYYIEFFLIDDFRIIVQSFEIRIIVHQMEGIVNVILLTLSNMLHCSSKGNILHSVCTFFFAGWPILTQSSTKWLIKWSNKSRIGI
jgi:hypothetical protein